MGANSPSELLSNLTENVSSGNLQGVVACYEPDAVFVLPKDQGGEARGQEAIGQAIAQFLALNPTLSTNATQVVEAAGVALILGEWTLEGTGPDGPVSMAGKFRDIVRQQPDGTWLYLVDNPFQPD
ncbi:MAG TPA: nuclear transport factor 2 family protein [Acidimicrobiia bacterium]|jgi:ketosteroid isomerase-like protein